MTVEFELNPVKFSRLATRGVILGLSIGQVWCLGIGIAVVAGSLYAGSGTLLLLTTPIWLPLAAAAWIPIAGRKAVDWAPVALHWAARSLAGQTLYRRRISRPRPAGTLALPGDAASLREYVDPVTGTVMVHDPHQRTLTAILAVTHPSFVLQDPAGQQRRVDGFSRVLASVCRSGRIARIQVLERTLADTGAGLAEWWDRHGSDEGTFAARTYRELIARAGPAGERHATTIAVALDLDAAARPIRAAGGGLPGAAIVLRQEMDTLSTALRAADLHPAGWYTPDQLATALLTAYDPHAGELLDRGSAVGSQLRAAGPIAIDEHWDRLRSDSAHHAVLWISEWPRSLVYPGFLTPLILSTGIRRTISITYTPFPASHAARDIRKRKTEYLSDSSQRARLGQIEDAQHGAEYGDVLQQEADLTAGHGILHYTGLLSISAPTPEALEGAIASIEQAAIQASCETRRLAGQQAQGFAAAALPLARPV